MPQVTLSGLKDRVRQRADMVNSSFITDEELTNYINNGYAELYDILTNTVEDWFIKEEVIDVTPTHSGSYTLPNDFYKLRGVDRDIGTNNYVTISKFNFGERNSYTPLRRVTYLHEPLVSYRIVGDKIVFEPRESAAGRYKLWYVPTYTPLVNDNDTLQGVNGWEEYVIVCAAINCLQKEQSSTYTFDQQKFALIKRIQNLAINRDDGESDRVRDVRNIDNDWGW